MKKLSILLSGLFLTAIVMVPAQAAFKFNVEEGFNIFSDSRLEGMNRHFDFLFDLNDDIDIGYFIENANLQLTGDVGANPANTTQLNLNTQGVRVVKKFSKWLAAGIDIGSARLQQGSCSGAFVPTAALNQNKPIVGLNGIARYGADIGDKLSADMHLSLGYRFMDLNDTAIGGAPAGESTLADLNSLIIGVGVGFRF